MKQIMELIAGLKDRVVAYDNKMGDKDGNGNDARPPEGEDYNEIHSDVLHTIGQIEAIQQPTNGRLWWNADSSAELAIDIVKLTTKGAKITKVWVEGAQIHFIFELDKAKAKEVLDYIPADEEWLIEEEFQS